MYLDFCVWNTPQLATILYMVFQQRYTIYKQMSTEKHKEIEVNFHLFAVIIQPQPTLNNYQNAAHIMENIIHFAGLSLSSSHP